MSVVRTIKVVVVLLALMAGLPTMAFAHSGHEHAASVTTTPSGSYSSITATQTKSQAAKSTSLAVRSINPRHADLVFQKPSSNPNIVLCTAGSCCCQGASSCGSGHCCSFGVASGFTRAFVAQKDMSYRLALLGTPYPDLIFGLDRPPKV